MIQRGCLVGSATRPASEMKAMAMSLLRNPAKVSGPWLSITAAMMLVACAPKDTTGTSETDNPNFEPWISTLLTDHALAGRIWSPKERRFMTPGELIQRMSKAKFVLLGERHDNPDHHRIQAWITVNLIKRGRRPALVMEMFRANQQPKIDDHLGANPGDSKGLGKATGWTGSGWPPWSQYEPIARPIVDRGLRLLAANLSRHTLRSVIRGGIEVLGKSRMRALYLDRPVSQKMLEAMDIEIAHAHCGFLDRSKARPFARIQLLRDALFAEAMRKGAAKGDGAILIAGTGHTRNDRGVPNHLTRAAIEPRDILALGIVEATENFSRPDQYGAVYGARRLPFDAVWFSPRTARPDPCDKFKKFRKKK